MFGWKGFEIELMTGKLDLRTSDTKEKIIKEAQRLYHEGGYKHMATEKITKTLNITRPALYHHFPGGKEELFREMISLYVNEKLSEMAKAYDTYPDTFSRLKQMIIIITSESVMDIRRMLSVEMVEFDRPTQELLWQKLYELRGMIMRVMQEAKERGEFRPIDPNVMFFSFLTLCGLCGQISEAQFQHTEMRKYFDTDRDTTISVLLDTWLNGVVVR